MTQKPQKNPIQMAGEVARHVELEMVALRSWSANFVGEGVPSFSDQLEGQTEHNQKFCLDRTTKLLDVIVDFSTAAREPEPKGAERFRVTCQLILRYSMQTIPDLNEEHFVQFAQLNAIMNAWPYFRELVQNSTSRMGLPPVVMPLFRVSRLDITERKAKTPS